MRGDWQPVLEGSVRADAIRVIESILTDLGSEPAGKRRVDPFISVLFAEASRVLDWPALMARAVTWMNAGAQPSPIGIGLYGGLCGLGWVTSWLRRHLTDGSYPDAGLQSASVDEEWLAVVDGRILQSLERWDPATHPFDLLSGLVGIGVYALERSPSERADTMLDAVISLLGSAAVPVDGGLAWVTSAAVLPPRIRQYTRGIGFNLGLAHGVPGAVAILAQLARQRIRPEQTTRLAEGATTWLLRQQLAEGDGARYAHWALPHAQPPPGRMAWCNGGLGVSIAILVASRGADQLPWEEAAVELALMESARPFERAGVHDACLCHGTAGNALIFQRFYGATGDPRFKRAAAEWFDRTLQMHTPGEGIGGYRFFNGQELVDDAGFLTGSAGVALGLLAAVSDVPPSWDRLLLTDIPS